MYKVICNGHLLHSSALETLQVHNGNVELEIGKTGTFDFAIYPNHPYYDAVALMQPGITVYRDDKIIFSGRALKIDYGFHNEKRVSCEGALSYLLDTLIEPDAYYGNFYGYMERLLNVHNAQVEAPKQFQMGNINIADFEAFEVVTDAYMNILDSINANIVSVTGGYLQVRYEDSIRYLDIVSYEADQSNVSSQYITFGKNLVNIQREADGSDVFTSIVPLGDEVDGARVTIGSVNNWKNYITNEEAVAQYGLIHKVVTFDGITDPQTLKNAAEQYFQDYYAEITNIEISVADTSLDSFLPGQWVNVYSKHHFTSIPTLLMIKQMTISLSSPEKTKITAGRLRRGFSESIAETGTATNGSGDASSLSSGKVLWSGYVYMQANQAITLSEPISKQKTGVILVFSRYSDGEAHNYNFNHFFVHKAFVAAHPGAGSQFLMSSDGTFGVVGSKYIYINDTSLTGNANNTATGTANGITYANNSFVLRYVIGV